jgi:hypothetical protein
MSEPRVLTGDTGTDIYTRTRDLYITALKDDPTFHWDFRKRIFGIYFAQAAHEHKIRFHAEVRLAIDLTPEQREDRRQYNMYYGTAKIKLIRYLGAKKSGKPEKKVVVRAVSPAPMPKPRLFPGPSNSEDRANAARAQLAKLAGDPPNRPKQLHLPGFIPEEVIHFIRDLHARFDKKPHR